MTKLSEASDNELESMWQAQYSLIVSALTQYYSTNDEELYELAGKAQKRQSEIQDEITRRSH